MNSKKSGFTIIEVVLVLAIAGLIFIIVFLALPALQRNQRDTQRRSDLGRFVAAMQTYQTNNSGSLPWTWSGTAPNQTVAADPNATTVSTASPTLSSLVPVYLDTFKDPTTNNPYRTVTTTPSAVGTVQIAKDKDCTGAAATGKVAITLKVENGTTICQTN